MSSLADQLVSQVDNALRTLTGQRPADRPNPAGDLAEAGMEGEARRHAAGLMRVNHTGEICAQALYEGQALTARKPEVRRLLESAACEEADHLAWCEQRLQELESRPSALNPVFYALSYAMGAATGLLGDRVSLGFVEATEDQVCSHLEKHLAALPAEDERSRKIVRRMHEDEARHGSTALEEGGVAFPEPVKKVMTAVSRIMTETSYRL